MAAFGAHARQAAVNEPSGARLFSGFGVEIGQCGRSWRAVRAETLRLGCNARHNVDRDMSSELCRRSTFSVCSGVSVTAVLTSAKISLVRRRFSGRDWSGAPRRRCLIFVLKLSSDQSGRNARISRGFRPLIEPLAQLSDVLRYPVNATTLGCKSCKYHTSNDVFFRCKMCAQNNYR